MNFNRAYAKMESQSFIRTGKVYRKKDLFEADVLFEPWQTSALGEFSSRMEQNSFPCLFARKAWSSGSARFAFAECDQIVSYRDALEALTEYTNFVRATDLSERLLVPLVMFFETSGLESKSLHAIGWDAINWLHEHDPAEWPAEISRSPDTPDWCFCFNGVQLFVNMSTPAHVALKSRNLGSRLTFVINPRENFDAVASKETLSGRLVRQNIRNRVERYNGEPAPDELGFYGHPDNREWRQYQLAEAGLDRPQECPFKARAIDKPDLRSKELTLHEKCEAIATSGVNTISKWDPQ